MYNLEPIVIIWFIFVIWYNVKFLSMQIYGHSDRSIGKIIMVDMGKLI